MQPCDFPCFGPLKEGIRGRRHETWEQLEEDIKTTIERCTAHGLFKGIEQMPGRWEWVIAEQGDYF